MVELRHHQRLVWEGWFPEQAAGWWEEWMRQADQVLDDDELSEAVYQAQAYLPSTPRTMLETRLLSFTR